MAVAADAGLDVELISYGHTVIQAANLHIALAFGRTSYFEQAVPPEPFEHGVRTPIRTGQDGLVHAPDGPGLGIELDDRAIERRHHRARDRERLSRGERVHRMRFEGRRVIVTGASRGIGRGIVDAFLDEGAVVLATDVLADGLDRARIDPSPTPTGSRPTPPTWEASTAPAASSPPRSRRSAAWTCS